jgi:nicotinate-nucleotide adenylyltransferase
VSSTIAVYGGSFDPPHLAHTLVCAYVLSTEAVDRLLVVPASHHPFDKQLSPFEHRLRMCELAMRDLRRVEISDAEASLQRPSLTLRTLEHLQRLHPDAALRLVIGSDLLPETPSWHRYDLICELAPPIVVPRAGYPDPEGERPALPNISSTEVRRRLREGLPTDGLLNPAVAAYATSHALYK